MSLSKEFEEVNRKIDKLEFKPAGIFTNSLLHTLDTTQLIRDIRADESTLFENRKISDIDYEVMNNIKDTEEKLLEEIKNPPVVDFDGELENDYPVDMQNDLKLLSTIEQRIVMLSKLNDSSGHKFIHSISKQILELNSLLAEVKGTIDEVKNLDKSIKDKENELPAILDLS